MCMQDTRNKNSATKKPEYVDNIIGQSCSVSANGGCTFQRICMDNK